MSIPFKNFAIVAHKETRGHGSLIGCGEIHEVRGVFDSGTDAIDECNEIRQRVIYSGAGFFEGEEIGTRDLIEGFLNSSILLVERMTYAEIEARS